MKGLISYRHTWLDGKDIPLPVGKVVCVGRNYAEHAKELNNPIPTEPLLFMKPSSSIVSLEQEVPIPTRFGEVHYESEIAILIGEPLSAIYSSDDDVIKAISGVGVALDLTLRELQSELKSKGQPWEKAKAFDGSCPLSSFVPMNKIPALTDLGIALEIDGAEVQRGTSADMLTPIVSLLHYIVQYFTLVPGDVVLTGTPKGVGKILPGQSLRLKLADEFEFSTTTC